MPQGSVATIRSGKVAGSLLAWARQVPPDAPARRLSPQRLSCAIPSSTRSRRAETPPRQVSDPVLWPQIHLILPCAEFVRAAGTRRRSGASNSLHQIHAVASRQSVA